tara:strand:- start:298 stop:804 length:507 start_codon:yes stop_codon:yes gene_type:complete
MKEFVILLLGIIFVALITSSVPSSAIDDTSTKNLKFEIYLHTVVRNAQGELISVAETSQCKFEMNCSIYLPHEITDYVFDTLLGKKEIITIGDIKYEKVQFDTSSKYIELFDVHDRELTGTWEVDVCGEPIEKYGYECVKVFWSRTSVVYLEMGDVTTVYWTILRQIS